MIVEKSGLCFPVSFILFPPPPLPHTHIHTEPITKVPVVQVQLQVVVNNEIALAAENEMPIGDKRGLTPTEGQAPKIFRFFFLERFYCSFSSTVEISFVFIEFWLNSELCLFFISLSLMDG